jgi:hypothetical protein
MEPGCEAEVTDGTEVTAIADVPRVRGLLIAAARDGHALSYSGLLARLGLRFTRPKMRALCRTLDRIDAEAELAGEPELAVLVVRESDGLPGQGWWTGHAAATGYPGAWEGPGALREVRRLQDAAFRHWRNSPVGPRVRPVRGATHGR